MSAHDNMTERELLPRMVGEMADGVPWLAALANVSALLDEHLDDINWVGFYLTGEFLGLPGAMPELLLGPFQGKVACVRIAWEHGVCGTAAARDATLRVDDVHAFPGHIACDAASRSEIVVPLHGPCGVVGVLDIDSPSPARFSAADQELLEDCVRALEARLFPPEDGPAS